MSKIENPGKGTNLRETTRQTVETGVAIVPGVGLLTPIMRLLLPSKLDKQASEWKEKVTEATNQHDEGIKGLSAKADDLELKYVAITDRVNDTRGHVEKLASKVEIGIVETDPLDGELEICLKLVLAKKFQTALDLLSEHFNDPKRSNQISSKLKAQILSLQGVCLKNLGQFHAASQHFLAALDIDPDNPKICNNAVIGYLIKKDVDAALRLLEQLIRDEPEMPMYWANRIYAQSHKSEVVDLKKLPIVVQKSEAVCLALIDTKRENDDLTWIHLALDAADLHPKSRRARRHGAEAALDLAMNSFVSDELSATEKTSILLRAEKAAAELSKQWANHLDTEASKCFPDVTLLQNTLIAHRVTGNDAEVAALINAHEDVLLSEDQAKQVLGAYALENHDETLLDKVLAEDFLGSEIIRLHKALRDAEWTEALDICEKYPEEIAPTGQIDPAFAADVLHAVLLEESEQTAAFEDIFSQEPQTDPKNDLFLCQLASNAGLQDVADTAFMRASAANIGTDAVLRRALAGEAMKRDMPDVVINLLATYVDPTRDDITRRWLAISYAQTSIPNEDGIKFFADIRSAHNTDAELNRAGGHFHLNRRRPTEAIPWFRKSLDLEPTNLRTQLAYLETLNYGGEHRRARDFLANVDLSLADGSVEDRMSMAQLLWSNGREEALEYAYKLVVRNRNDFQVCFEYSLLLLANVFNENAPQIPAIDQVSIGAMVRLGRVAQDDWVIVIDENHVDLPGYVQSDNPIIQQAMGKKIGDQFESTSGPSHFTWTVKEIKSKYLHLFHEITRTLQDQFPDNGSFYLMTIVDDDVIPILGSVSARRKSVEDLDENYRDHLMPLGAIANAGGVSTIAFAVHLAQSGQKIFSATGHPQDTEREFKIACSARDRTIVLDAYTAWLLDDLDVLQVVKDVFPKLTIPASSFDEFGQMIDELSCNLDGRKFIVARDDGFVIHESMTEEVMKLKSSLETTRQHIAGICQVLGIEVPATMDRELLQMSNFLGNQFDCLSVMLRESGILLSADLRFRKITTEIYKEEAFGLDVLLRILLIEGALSINTHANTLIELCGQGHSYVFLNGEILHRMLIVDETVTLERFEKAAAYLGATNADINSHILTSSDFIRRAFQHYNGDLKAQRATGIVLHHLLQIDGIELADMLTKLVSTIDDIRVNNYIEQWLKENSLWETYKHQIDDKQIE